MGIFDTPNSSSLPSFDSVSSGAGDTGIDFNAPTADAIPYKAGLLGLNLNLPTSDLSLKSFTSGDLHRRTVVVKAERWNQKFPYSFGLATASDDGSVTTFGDPKQTIGLNIPPQAIQVQVQFANSVTATNGGILEEHNGVIFRSIMISGTTGINPDRASEDPTLNSNNGLSLLENVFPQAVQAFGALSKAVSGLVSGVNGGSDPVDATFQTSTGYATFWNLHNFFIKYAEIKRLPGQENIRLLFNVPKDNISYVVTPVSFELKKDSRNPHLYQYAISLRCYDIAVASPPGEAIKDQALSNPVGFIKDALNTIRKARRAMTLAENVIRGVQSDVNDVLQVVNQTVLFFKDAVGLGATAADFPSQIANNATLLASTTRSQFKSAIADFAKATGDADQFNKALGQGALGGEEKGGFRTSLVSISSSAESTGSVTRSSSAGALKNDGTQQLGSPRGEAEDQSSISNPRDAKLLNKALANPDFTDSLSLGALDPLPASVQEQINVAHEKALSTSSGDVQRLADKLQEVSNNLAYNTGMMDPAYAKAYGLPSSAGNLKIPTEDDILLAASIQGARGAYLGSLGLSNFFNQKPIDPFAIANQVLSLTDQVKAPNSAFPMTMSQGDSLESLARRYLGTPDRAKEIAILNELRAPYIDEKGFSLPISLAASRSFVVTDASQLGIGQTLILNGTGISPSRRKITNIKDIGGTFEVVVDGPTTVSLFSASTNPHLSARKLGTVGSGDTLLIPSTAVSKDPLAPRSTPLYESLSHAERVFGIDIQLDENSDIVTSSSGDVGRSYGYANAVQALRLILETEKGELARHPSFGINAGVGERISAQTLADVKERIRGAIVSDRRFSDAQVEVTREGTAVRIRVQATGAAGTGLIPIEFQVSA